MSGALVLAYYKENGIFYIVSAYESGYENKKDIPIGTPDNDEFVKLDKEWIENIETQYVIDHEPTADRVGRYSIRRKNNKFGFPKGGAKGTETPLDTAVREFDEEVGYNLDPTKLKVLQQSEYTVYTYNVLPDEKKTIEGAIATMKANRKGELFEVMFRSLEDIKKEKRFMNRKSIDALFTFERNLRYMGGGSRKLKTRSKTTRRKRAKRQTSK
jgi:8-oxo-dGTP pyrophosphatase MutT (NUDIX family)